MLERTNVRDADPGGDRRPGRADRRRPVVHLAAPGAARAGRLHRARRRPAADGQAAVRGRARSGSAPAAWSATRRCGPRPCSTSRRGRARLGLGVAGVVASPLPGPAGNVEFFLWLRRGAARRPTPDARSRRAAWPVRPGRRDPVRAAGHPHRPPGHASTTPGTVAARPDRGRLRGAGARRGGRRPRHPDAGVGAGRRSRRRRRRRDRLRARRRRHVPARGRAGPPGQGPAARASTSARSASSPRPRPDDLDQTRPATSWHATYTVEERLTLDVRRRAGRRAGRRVAGRSTRCRVEKGERERMLELLVDVDGRPLSRYGCDGVVCATPDRLDGVRVLRRRPGGVAGGEALLLVPISAHALFSRPLVTAPTRPSTITVDPYTALAVLCCDGRRVFDLPPGARVDGAPRRRCRCGSPGCTRGRSPTGWWPSSACRWTAGAATSAEPRGWLAILSARAVPEIAHHRASASSRTPRCSWPGA